MAINSAEEKSDKISVMARNGIRSMQQSLIPFRNHKYFSTIFPATITALIAAGFGLFYFIWTNHNSENIVKANGRIETPETYIRAASATRVKSITVKEGDLVHKGELIITLDSADLQKRINDSSPSLNAALHARRQTDAQVAAVQNRISTARAKSHGFFAEIFSTKGGREQKEMQLRSEMMQAKMMSMQARSTVSSMQGARSAAQSKLSYFNITSPIDGICTVRSAQPGELVAAGQVMLILVNPDSAYLRGFVPESDIARIKIGQTALVSLDSPNGKALNGRVTSIDAEASFTPENVYFEKDRERQAFGIKVAIDHPNGLAKPGMPAEAEINVKTDEKRNQW